MTLKLPVYEERRGRFARLHDANVLIYWPHGLGDWAHLSRIVGLLEPSNRYAVTRYGDDYVALFEGNPYARPIYSGTRAISDGSPYGARHFGLNFKRLRGAVETVNPAGFEDAFAHERFDALLYTDYPEREGRTRFPFQTKARAMLHDLTERARLQTLALDRVLPATIAFDTQTPAAVQERLHAFCGENGRLLLFTPSGHTAERKNWERALAQRFVALALRAWPDMQVLSFDESAVRGEAADRARAYSDLFGDLGLPFAQVLKALVCRASAAIGVPAGPLHVALARDDLPVVGLWHAHHPDWYEERNATALHLIGGEAVARRLDRRPATRSTPEHLRNRTLTCAPSQIPPEAAIEALSALFAERKKVAPATLR